MANSKLLSISIYILLILGLILTAIGGWLDYTEKSRWGLSKQHYWNDGGILILLSIFLQIYSIQF